MLSGFFVDLASGSPGTSERGGFRKERKVGIVSPPSPFLPDHLRPLVPPPNFTDPASDPLGTPRVPGCEPASFFDSWSGHGNVTSRLVPCRGSALPLVIFPASSTQLFR